MALSAGCHIEVRNGGSDTICGGAFDPTQTAGMYTDGAATSANTSAPVFSSASYNFVAGDVDAYLFIGDGTNWTKGWYKIASVASNVATLSASASGYQAYGDGVNTSDGCASVASPTGATWSIDYSQQAAAEFSCSDGTAGGAGSTLSSATIGFGKQMVGNAVRITAGTNCTTGHHVITSVAAGVATFNNAVTTGATANGTLYLGGALATDGYAGGRVIAGNTVWIKYSASAYAATTTSSNVASGTYWPAGGSAANPVVTRGYDATRGDYTSNRPTLQWGVNAANNWRVVLGGINTFDNIIVDGNRANFTGPGGVLQNGNHSKIIRVKIMGCTFQPMYAGSSSIHEDVEVTDCTAAACSAANYASYKNCHFHDNSGNAITCGTSSSLVSVDSCVFDTNGDDAIEITSDAVLFVTNSTFYGQTGAGILFSAAPRSAMVTNCVFEGNSTYGVSFTTGTAPYRSVFMYGNAFYNNTSGKYQGSYLPPYNVVGEIIPTSSPFVDAANGDFRLNVKQSGGALLRGGSYPSTYTGATWSNRRDVGAVQHGGVSSGMSGGMNG